MGSDWSHPDVVEWKKTTAVKQKNIYLMFGRRIWDSYTSKEHDLLASKIAFALFGPPLSAHSDFNRNR
jgi:hypothetical protein